MSSNPKVLQLLSRPIVYQMPKRLLAPPSWTMHAPLALWIIDILKPGRLVELGTFSGTSYCAFCQAVRELRLDTKCFAVDTWKGDSQSHFYGEEILSDLKAYHDPLYSEFSTFIRKDFDSAREDFQDGTIDLLHIDGLHTYEAVKHDFETWLPKLSKRAVVLFHDTQVRRDDFGVYRFWAEVASKYSHLEVDHGNGLGILLVGSEVSRELRDLAMLAASSEQEKLTFQNFFEHLGLLCLKEVQLQEQRLATDTLNQVIAAQKAEIQTTHNAWALRGEELERRTAEEHALRNELAQYKERSEQSLFTFGGRARSVLAAGRSATLNILRTRSLRAVGRGMHQILRAAKRVYSSARIACWLHSNRRLVVGSGLFDLEFYLKEHADKIPSGTDPLTHFLLHGGYAGLRCSALFDAGFYQHRYPDVRTRGEHPLVHYLNLGRREGRSTSAEYAPDMFLEQRDLPHADCPTRDNPRIPAHRATLFVVYGVGHVDFIRDIFIPNLRATAARRPVELHLLNYAGNTALLESIESTESLVIRDWSAHRDGGQIGFGEAHNFLFNKVAPKDAFVIVNPDSCPLPGCLDTLYETYAKTSAGIVEARQWPRAHPKEFDLATGNTPWASGAFSLIDSEVFAAIGGFDPVFFLYGEDVDLSWRVWLAGKRVVHAPKAICSHFTGLYSYRSDRFYYENFYSMRNFIVLARKFFGDQGERYAKREVDKCNLPVEFKRAILDSYDGIRSSITEIPAARHPMIKILGMNMYHLYQPAHQVTQNVEDNVVVEEAIAHVG